MNGQPNARHGFTIIELLVVAVLGLLLVMAAYQVLNTNQRAYAVQSEKVRGQQTLRAAMEVLTAEFRELSPEEGDIVRMASDGVEVRIPRRFGLVCEVNYDSGGLLGLISSSPELRVMKYEEWFSDGDSVVVFADHEPATSLDDEWISAQVTAVDTTSACDGLPAQVLTFAGQQSSFPENSVLEGAPIRSRMAAEFGLSGDGNLWRSVEGSTSDLVGPVDLALSYYDSLGHATTTPTDVAQIQIKLSSSSEIRTSGGHQVRDSLVARVYPRN